MTRRTFAVLLTCAAALSCLSSVASQSANPCTFSSLQTKGLTSNLITANFTAPWSSSNLLYTSGVVSINSSGTSVIANDSIQLTTSGQSSVGAVAWLTSPFRFVDFFHVSFSYSISAYQTNLPNNQAEGFAFVLLAPSASLPASQGTGSLNLGYNLAQSYSLAVEFDMHYDGLANDPQPPGTLTVPNTATSYACNHVEVHGSFSTVGNGPSTGERLYPGSNAAQPAWLAANAMVSGAHDVDIEYQAGYGGSGSGLLTVWIDGNVVLQYPSVPDASVSAIFPNNTAYFGFTSSTGVDSNSSLPVSATTLIYNVSVYTNLASPNYTQALLNNGSSVALAASASAPAALTASSAAVNLRAYDYCNTSFHISAGTFSASLLSSSLTAIGSTRVLDWGNGSYAVFAWWTAASSSFSLSLSNNGRALASSPFPVTISAGLPSASTTTYVTSASLANLTAGTVVYVNITLRDAYSNPAVAAQLAPYDLQIGINNPGTDTTNLLYPVAVSGAVYSFHVVTSTASALGATNAIILGAVSLTLYGSNIVNSPVNNVVVSPATVSGANSSLSGAALIELTAGTTATVTLQPNDAFGNPVLASVVATLALVGGSTGAVVNATSQWLASSSSSQYPLVLFNITATVVDTYSTIVFVGPTVHTLQRVPDQHTPTVLASSVVNASRSYWYGLSNGVAGTSSSNAGITFSIQSADAYGNRIPYANGGSYVYTVTVSTGSVASVSVVCQDSGFPTPTAVISSSGSLVYGNATCVYSQSSSTYSVKLAAFSTSRTYTAAVTLNGSSVPLAAGSTASFTVAPAAASAAQSSFVLRDTALSAGQTGYLTVTVRDEYGNVRAGDNDTVALWNSAISFTSDSSVGSVLCSIAGMNTSLQGSYTQSFTPRTAATYSVDIQLAGAALSIASGTNSIAVIPGAFVPANLQLSGSGLAGGLTGSVQSFTLAPYDGYGNQLWKTVNPNVSFLVNVSTAVGWQQGNVSAVSDSTIFQSYTVLYTVPAVSTDGTISTNATIRVYNGSSASPAELCTQFTAQVLLPPTDNATAVLPSSTVVAGTTSYIQVTPRNAQGEAVNNTDSFSLSLIDANNQSSPLTVFSCVLLTDSPGTCGRWNFTLYQTVSGAYRLQVLVITSTGTSETSQSSSGIPLTVVPAAVSAAASVLTATSATSLQAGQPFTFNIQFNDAFGNHLTASPNAQLQLTASPADTPLTPAVFTDNGDGTYNCSVTYSTAAYFTLNVTMPGGAGIASGLTVSYSAAAFNGSVSDIKSVVATSGGLLAAGSSARVTLFAFDAYGNPLSSALICTLTFTRDFDSASSTFSPSGGDTGSNFLTVVETGSATYTLTTANLSLSDYSQQLAVTAACGAGSASSPTVTAYSVWVYPAELSDRLSSVLNWPSSDVTAGSTLNLSLSLFDTYGNPWGPSSSVSPRALFSASIPRDTLLNVVNALGVITSPASLPGRGLYNVSYTPTLASSSYQFVYEDDTGLQHSLAQSTFTVVALPTPSAPRTTLSPSPLNQTMVAGVAAEAALQFADVYGNPIAPLLLNASLADTAPAASAITAQFYVRNPTAFCLDGDIDTSQSAEELFTGSRLTLAADESSISLIFSTELVGSYFVMIYVGSEAILSSCSALPATLGFAVVHAPVYLPGSVVSQASAGELRAGAALSLSIQLVDAFNNSINDLNTTTTLTPPDASSTSPCSSSLPVFPWDNSTDNIAAPVSGSFVVSFTATTAGSYVLPFTLDGELVGAAASCPSITIFPSYLYSFTTAAASAAVAGVQSSFSLGSYDVYGNLIPPTELVEVYTAVFSYYGDGQQQPPFQFSASSGEVGGPSSALLSFYADLAGEYEVTVSIPADPSDPSHRTASALSYNLTVQPESCAAQTGDSSLAFRCGNGSCVASYSDCSGYTDCPLGSYLNSSSGLSVCLASYPTQSLCPANLTLCALPSASADASYLLQHNAVSFFCSVVCPTAWLSAVYPVDCGNGVLRQTLADCPSQRVCPFLYSTCPDGSCVPDGSDCDSTVTQLLTMGEGCAAAGGVQCRDGRCVDRAENCGTERSCGDSALLCADGSCQSSVELCPNSNACGLPSAPFLCSTGDCRPSAADCPSPRVCPVSFVLCPGGECAAQLADCQQEAAACDGGMLRCGDGSCRSNHLQCPTVLTCPTTAAVHCADGSCASDVSLCPPPPACSSPTPFVCPDGTCGSNATTCYTPLTCPPSAPVLCADRSCALTAAACEVLVIACPASAPIRCSDGACQGSYTDCSSQLICPSAIPVRCPDGSCAISVLACPLPLTQLACNSSLVRCPSGHCAASIHDCPTTVSCGVGLLRCGDGTCRPDCDDSLALTSFSYCGTGEILCPRTSSGVACAPELSLCPTEISCPSALPVRCVDNTCAASQADCPAVTSLITDQYVTTPCMGGGWTDELDTCGTAVTCPAFAPVKCWDESCRLQAEDCPPKLACPFGVTDAASFLCSDGSCHGSPSACSSLIQCDYPQVKCPSDTAGGAGVFCVDEPEQCTDLFQQPDNAAVCPNSFTRCRNGNCMPSVQSCPAFTCPAQLPFLCPAGVCTAANASCPMPNGCPATAPVKCWDGSCSASAATCSASVACSVAGETRCADGSCSAGTCYSPDSTGCPSGSVRCWDKNCADSWSDCTDASDDFNACPASRPYWCDDGYCAVSARACPRFPPVASDLSACSASQPTLCADGSCAAFASQCPAMYPCALGTSRCGDGSCRITGACPTVNSCPASRPLRCQSGLCVAATVSALTVYLESTTADDPNCIDESTRDGLSGADGSPDSRGCPWGLIKCINGSCASSCSVSTAGLSVAALTAFMYPNGPGNGCPSASPVKCWDGSCLLLNESCPATTGCPASSPALCGDGSCQANATACSNSSSCPAETPVRCPNAQCAASFAACQAVNGCPVHHPLRCANGQCALYPAHLGSGAENSLTTAFSTSVLPLLTSTCPPTPVCDSVLGFLCADLTCAATPAQCRPLLPCPASYQLYCPVSQQCLASDALCPEFNASALCAASSPILCDNGACVSTQRQCLSPYAPAGVGAAVQLCTEPLVACFDGTCASSYSTCYQRAYTAYNAGSAYAAFNPDVSVMNSSCSSSAEFPCSNGLCLWDQQPSTVALCPPLPACSAAFPLRCSDGSCVAAANSSVCSVLAACQGGGYRCADGSCRAASSQCVMSNGCNATLPFFCPGVAEQCVASLDDCQDNALLSSSLLSAASRRLLQSTAAVAGSQVCAENCERDRVAVAQQVSLIAGTATVIDVSVDAANVVRTQIVIVAGAMPAAITVFAVAPVATSALQSSTTPFASTVLSSPFSCYTQADAAFVSNITVNAAVDLQLPSGAAVTSTTSSSSSTTVSTPCAITTGSTAFGVLPDVDNGELSNCTGSLQLSSEAMQLNWTSTCSSPDVGLTLTGELESTLSLPYAPGFTDGYGASCLCYNLTRSSSAAYPVASTFCLLVSYASSTSAYIAAFSISSASTRCPGTEESAASNQFLLLSPPSSLSSSCASSSSDTAVSISASDICLGAFYPSLGSWSCVYSDYYWRLDNPPWTSAAGRATNRMQSPLPACSAATASTAYAFIYSPAVAPVTPAGPSCNLWCQYEALILGLSIGITCFLILSAYVIWRLIRYRRKYLANKAENLALSARARHLDEYAGGLGVADEEVDMVGNPLVLEMRAVEQKLGRLSGQVGITDLESEQQLRLIRELEQEHRRLQQELLKLRETAKARAALSLPKGPARASLHSRQQVSPVSPVLALRQSVDGATPAATAPPSSSRDATIDEGSRGSADASLYENEAGVQLQLQELEQERGIELAAITAGAAAGRAPGAGPVLLADEEAAAMEQPPQRKDDFAPSAAANKKKDDEL